MKWSYRVALICAVVPLITGVSIFLFWVVTRWDGLRSAGICTLIAGAAAFLVGIIELACYGEIAFRTPNVPARQVRFSSLVCGLLLFSNFPVAAGIVVAANAIDSCYTVVIHNHSQKSLERVGVFADGGCEADFGTIPSGETVQRSFWILGDGELEFRAVSGSTPKREIVDDYVTHDMGGHTTITCNSDGTVSHSNEHR